MLSLNDILIYLNGELKHHKGVQTARLASRSSNETIYTMSIKTMLSYIIQFQFIYQNDTDNEFLVFDGPDMRTESLKPKPRKQYITTTHICGLAVYVLESFKAVW